MIDGIPHVLVAASVPVYCGGGDIDAVHVRFVISFQGYYEHRVVRSDSHLYSPREGHTTVAWVFLDPYNDETHYVLCAGRIGEGVKDVDEVHAWFAILHEENMNSSGRGNLHCTSVLLDQTMQ